VNETRSSTLTGVALVAAAATSWGTWSIFLRPIDLPSPVTTPVIFLVMAATTLPFALRGPRARWDATTIALLVANAVFDVATVLAYFAAIAHTTVAVAVLTHYFAPVLIALAGPRVEGTRAPGARLAAVIALLGLLIVLEPWRTPADGVVLGAIFGLTSAVTYAANVFSVRKLASRIGAAKQMGYHTALAAVVAIPFAAVHADQLDGRSLVYLAAGGVLNGAVAGVLFTLGLRRISSATAAVLTFIEPIVAVAIGAAMFDEPVHAIAALGGAMVVGAGIWVARAAVAPVTAT